MKDRTEFQVERIVFFSDAVFAIAITLLIIEVKVPHLPAELPESEVWRELIKLVPQLIGYFTSFLVIGAYWVGHHRIYKYIAGYDDGLIWRNLLVLMSVAFIPFTTAFYSEYFYRTTASVLYLGSLASAGMLEYWQWRYAAKDHVLLVRDTDPNFVHHLSTRLLVLPLVCLIAVALSFADARMASLSLFAIPLVRRIIDRTYRRKSADTSPS